MDNSLPTVPFVLADLVQFKKGGFPPSYPTDCFTFWAGRDDVHGAISAVLGSAVHSIVISMFGYDDNEFDKLIRDKLDNENIFVQMSLDKTQAAGVHEKEILALWANNDKTNSIAIGQSAGHAINHTKVVIVDGRFLISGSTNWSTSGESKQNNELTIRENAVVCAEARSELDIIHNVMLQQMSAAATKAIAVDGSTKT